MKDKSRIGRWVALGIVVGLVAAWGGFGIAEGAPSSITTCTTNKSGKIKLSKTGACTTKTQTRKTWDDHAVVQAQLARVDDLSGQVNLLEGQILNLNALIASGGDQIAALTAQRDALITSVNALSQIAAASQSYERVVRYSYCQDRLDLGDVCPTNDSSNAALSGQNLHRFHLNNINLEGANLAGATIDHAMLKGARGVNANLTGVHAGYTSFNGEGFIDYTVFSGADFSGADLNHTDLTWFDGIFANFTNANLTMAFSGVSNLYGANFTNANLTSAVFPAVVGLDFAIFDNTTCPDGSNSDAHSNTCMGHGMTLYNP